MHMIIYFQANIELFSSYNNIVQGLESETFVMLHCSTHTTWSTLAYSRIHKRIANLWTNDLAKQK